MAPPLSLEADSADERSSLDLAACRALLAVSRATAAHRDLSSLLHDLAEILRQVARFDRVAIVLHDADRGVMRLRTLAADHPPAVTEIELPVAESPGGAVWRTQQPLIIGDIDGETRFPEILGILRREGMRSLCVVPLSSALRRLGGLSFASREANAFAEADIAFFGQLSNQVALAVDNALHHEAAQAARGDLVRERDRLRLLLDINTALVSNLDPRALFSRNQPQPRGGRGRRQLPTTRSSPR